MKRIGAIASLAAGALFLVCSCGAGKSSEAGPTRQEMEATLRGIAAGAGGYPSDEEVSCLVDAMEEIYTPDQLTEAFENLDDPSAGGTQAQTEEMNEAMETCFST